MKIKKTLVVNGLYLMFYTLCLFFTFNSFSQSVGIGASTYTPDPSAILEVSSTTKGQLFPSMTTDQRDNIHNLCSCTPAEGLLIFNTTNKCIEKYVNGFWQTIFCGCSVAPTAPIIGTPVPSQTQIVWNWNSVSGATGYKWGTTNVYSSATDNGTGTAYTQTGLTANTAYTIYVWAYNACGNSSSTTLTQTTKCGGGAATSACNGITMLDTRDNTVYSIVGIGTQCWMAQNLNYGTYVAVHASPQLAGEKFCQNLSGANDATCPMGGLYEWANMMNGSAGCNGDATCPPCTTPVKGLCPTGWHIPSHYEWTLLEKNVGSNPDAFPYDITTHGVWLGTNEGGNMKATPICGTLPCWLSPNIGATNTSGFTALPGGDSWTGSFNAAGGYGYWWSATESGASAWHRFLGYQEGEEGVYRRTHSKEYGYSIRCVKD